MSDPDSTLGAAAKGTIDGDMVSCWLCRHAVSVRALFCHKCGAVQPPRELDHFTRLGVERRFDVDLALLDRQYNGFRRTLAPERFVAKGARERENAERQAAALTRAYDTLKEPVGRARHLLQLGGIADAQGGDDPDLAEMAASLAGGADPGAIDRVANQAGQAIESGIRALSAAFRAGDLFEAARRMVRLERLEHLAAAARRHRIAPPPNETMSNDTAPDEAPQPES